MGDATTPLRVEFPAAPDQLPVVRARLRQWLSAALPDPDRAYDLLLAVCEACTNSIEHGHRGDGGPIRLDAVLDADTVRVTVTDHGRWAPHDPQPDSRRGRGLALMRALVPDTDLLVLDDGTTVRFAVPVAPAARTDLADNHG
ncbi:ATP-binding protein [Nocardia takedensis]|uniref:ATP-binding protein n=1 Tax=Nocardia takedensis TaxID=259390 RepID=UPI0002E4C25C|nr:ATP-binding protein [Nocardia takedensis]